MAAACAADVRKLEAAALAAGYLLESDSAARRQAMIELFMLVGEPARQTGAYDFGNADLTLRLRDSAYAMGLDQGHRRLI